MRCVRCKAEIPEGSAYCNICGKKQIPEKRKAAKRANGMGTVYKVGGPRRKPWAAARNHVFLGYYATKREGLDALERTAGITLDERYNMTFSQVFSAWKQEHYREIGPKGIEGYDNAYKIFSSLHRKKFRDLRTSDFQAVIDRHMRKSRSTVSKYKQLITQMSAWAIREEIIQTNFAGFTKLPESVRKEKEIFTESEIELIRREAETNETAKIVMMLIATGMRIGELFSLPVADWHGTYVIGGEKTEAGRNRIIPIRPEGREYFAYFAAQADGELLLSGYTGNKLIDLFRRRNYYKLLDQLGIARKTPHATRHTYASRARREGLPPEILQKVLGHADYSTTANIYVHHADAEELVQAIEASAGSGVSPTSEDDAESLPEQADKDSGEKIAK